MKMTLAQLDGFANAIARSAAVRIEEMAIAARAAQASDKSWSEFLMEIRRGQ